MRHKKLFLSLAVSFAVAALISVFGTVTVLSIAAAVAAHELGHLAAVYMQGCRVKAFYIQPSGLCIDYTGAENEVKNILIALTGPLFGLVYAGILSVLNMDKGGEFIKLSADISLLYSVFNLAPVFPLDGGRAFEILAELCMDAETASKLSRRVSKHIALIFAGMGMFLFLKGEGGALLAAGIWLLILQQ